MNKFRKLFYILSASLVLAAIFFSSLHLYHGDIMFHTDVARDVLLVEEMVNTQKPDLIGPRAGGIPGLFFGPIWYYLMIPFFIAGGGNPLGIGLFWFCMVIASLATAWYTAQKVFGRDVGVLTAVLYSAVLIPLAPGFTQSFGSLILSPIIFLLLFRFYQTAEKRVLILLIILLGLLFHLQPAFAMLMIIMSFLFSIFVLHKAKRLSNLLYFLIIGIPLSNYILFEFRHDFLQVKAFFGFLTNPPSSRSEIDIAEMVLNRLDGFMARLNLLQVGGRAAPFLSLILNAFIIFKSIKNKMLKSREFYLIFYVFYIAFWLLTFLFKGIVWDYYHWAFLPLVVIIISSLYNIIPKKVYFVLFILVFIPIFNNGIKFSSAWRNNFSGTDSSSWKLNRSVASYIYEKSNGQDFGYYVYSPDEFGFSVKYAVNYLQQFNSESTAGLCMKKPITFIVYYPTPEQNSKTDPRYFKEERVKISKSPVSVRVFGNELKVEEYELSGQEIGIPSDTNIICNLHFR